LIVDQRAGLSNKDQGAARDREGDQFHIDTPFYVSDGQPGYGGDNAEINSKLNPLER
jgi:hypothetical protein